MCQKRVFLATLTMPCPFLNVNVCPHRANSNKKKIHQQQTHILHTSNLNLKVTHNNACCCGCIQAKQQTLIRNICKTISTIRFGAFFLFRLMVVWLYTTKITDAMWLFYRMENRRRCIVDQRSMRVQRRWLLLVFRRKMWSVHIIGTCNAADESTKMDAACTLCLNNENKTNTENHNYLSFVCLFCIFALLAFLHCNSNDGGCNISDLMGIWMMKMNMAWWYIEAGIEY